MSKKNGRRASPGEEEERSNLLLHFNCALKGWLHLLLILSGCLLCEARAVWIKQP